MNEVVTAGCALLVLFGTTLTIYERDAFDKLISLSVLVAGVIPFIVARGYLDIATATALIAPLSTIFTLMVLYRRHER